MRAYWKRGRVGADAFASILVGTHVLFGQPRKGLAGPVFCVGDAIDESRDEPSKRGQALGELRMKEQCAGAEKGSPCGRRAEEEKSIHRRQKRRKDNDGDAEDV